MALTTAASLTALGLYLNGKHHVVSDLKTISSLRQLLAAPKFMAEKQAANEALIYHALQAHALVNRPNQQFLEFEGRSWTYRQFYEDVQRVGNWLMNNLDIGIGELVAIDGPNTAEYMMLSFALDAIGASPAYINCNLSGAALEHCVRLCKAKHLIADRSVHSLIEPSAKTFESDKTMISYFDQAFFASLKDRSPIPRARTESLTVADTKSLIYTSGTTGHPKGTIISIGKMLITGQGTADFLHLTPKDKMYTCLPLYHGAAIGLCVLPTVWAGGSIYLSRKFSHKTFWAEVSESKANILQYVGELCRYLVNAPSHPMERQHQVQIAWGNGMRPDVWEKFRQRFNIPIIHELYAATDGMGATFNANKGPFSRGAIAVRGSLLRRLLDRVQIRAKIDPDTEDIIRGPDGFIIKCKTGEPGEVLHKVEEAMKLQVFRGYYGNQSSTDKRWMNNVLQKGDLYFRSGDVMREDEHGRVYFVDRLGDTFRWKSENVSTNEVSDTLGLSPQVAECSVYGVAVPNADGRCGCATIVLADGINTTNFDPAALARHVVERLPKYAVPVFLRISPGLSYTGTFKVQKGQAKREGIDLDLIEKSSKDVVYWLPPGASAYRLYSRDDYKALLDGKVKL